MSTVDDVISWANLELGKPYVYGDEGPNTFDCSGLMQWIFGKVGVGLPRTAAQQQAWATRVTSPQPGDLVFWGDPAYHVALYIGGGKVIAAPNKGSTVRIQPLWGTPSGYGRVKGVGAGAAPYLGAVTGVASTVGGTVAGWLGGARYTVLEMTFVGMGLVLVGYGLSRLVAPRARAAVAAVKGALP